MVLPLPDSPTRPSVSRGRIAKSMPSIAGATPAGVLWLNDQVLVADMGADYVAVVDPLTSSPVSTLNGPKFVVPNLDADSFDASAQGNSASHAPTPVLQPQTLPPIR